MLAESLENLLSTSDAASVTESFMLVIVGFFIVSCVLSRLGAADRLVANTPNLLTSLGILGTFVGIVIGLMGFDAADIDGSIEFLLSGLETAFVTSLAGMGSSIVFKVLAATPLVTPKVKVSAGRDLGSVLLEAIGKQSAQLDQIRKALTGDEDSSIAGQIKLARGDARDRHDLQRTAFESFSSELWTRLAQVAEMMSKSATEQVINALKAVIVDFNRNLTEQFGENFKALDASVQKLVEWQENYRTQIEQMTEQYRRGVAAIEATEASIASVSKHSQAIPQAMESLSGILTVNQHQIEELDRHLQAFSDARDRAVDAVPELQRRVDDAVSSISQATDQLSSGIVENTQKMNASVTTGVEEFDANVQRLSANLTSTSDTLAVQADRIRERLEEVATDLDNSTRVMVDGLTTGAKILVDEASSVNEVLKQAGVQMHADTRAVQEEFVGVLDQLQRRLEGALQEVFQAQTREIDKVFSAIDKAVADTASRTGENVNEQLRLIDESMQRELDRVLTEMGRALAMISNRFTSDYTKLVEAMQIVVQQSGNAR